MNDLTLEEKQRLWKADTNPVRKIFLWGFDSKKNPCLLILLGEQEFQREIRTSSSSYYASAYLLKPVVVYTKYVIFHGMNGHLPSIPDIYYSKESNLLCYTAGYKSATGEWYNDKDGWHWQLKIDPKYNINGCDLGSEVAFDYYADNNYSDYVSYLKSKNIQFEDFEIIDDPSILFGFVPDSPYMETIISMFSKERVYTRKKYLKQFIDMQPSVEDYQRILKVASVELACGIFQELTIKRNPILLETAIQIDQSPILWSKVQYHNGLNRCIKQYISLFDERLMRLQKEFIYRTLPEMDFKIKRLVLYDNKKLEGKDLEEYLGRPFAYQNICYMFGIQKFYERNTYTDGTNINNIKFKDTIQTANAYDMADVIGKIAYYLDTPRTPGFFKGSKKTGAYHYYVRYLRRILDRYLVEDEHKFITAAKEMLVSYTEQDNLACYGETYFAMNYFFNRYFRNVIVDKTVAAQSIWNRYIEEVVYVAKNAKSLPVYEFCYVLLKRFYDQHTFESYEIKELIELSDIPYEKTAALFKEILLSKLREQQEFDADIMIHLMNTRSEELWNAAEIYFKQTNGKFKPEDIVEFLFMEMIEKWYAVLEDNISHFTSAESIAFLKSLAEKREDFIERQIILSKPITELLQQTVNKLEASLIEEKQELFCSYLSLVLNGKKMPDFLFNISETILFFMPYDQLKDILKDMDLQHGRLRQREYNSVTLLESVQNDVLPKDSIILSVLENGSPSLVKMLTEIAAHLQDAIADRTTTMLLLFECNVFNLNQTAQSVFEGMETEKRERFHMILLDSPVERAYQYGLKKLDEWYGNKTPVKFILRMMEHPCVQVKAYLSEKIEKAFTDLGDVNPDLYMYYVKALLYMPNKVSKSKEDIYHTIPVFLKYYPERQKEIEDMLLDIGSTNSKINSERALVAFARIQKEVGVL